MLMQTYINIFIFANLFKKGGSGVITYYIVNKYFIHEYFKSGDVDQYGRMTILTDKNNNYHWGSLGISPVFPRNK
jgi:hypothetical protein